MDVRQHGAARAAILPGPELQDRRWDPGFWLRGANLWPDGCRWPLRPLGEFIAHITYGPILPGRRPQPVAEGVAIIGQKAVRATGVRLDRAVRVAEGSAYDLPRCRLRPRDIVLCRCGVGSLGRRRFAVYDEPSMATVSCFVDLIRLRELNPYYVVTFLRSQRGWAQIERVINGVGPPNLSFGEIRSLLVPLPPEDEQRAVERTWQPVQAAHGAGNVSAAEAALDAAVARLDARLD
jgi:hypothetical protein